MRIIYTCPKCGSDIDEVILATYPPKYMKRCKNLKCGWTYIEEPDEDAVVRIPYTPPVEDSIPACCRGCSNHPRNGGSGICNCTLPYMTSSGDVISYGGRADGKAGFDNTSL